MEETENKNPEQEKNPEQKKELLYSEDDFELYKKKLESEFSEKETQMKTELEQEAKRANLSELERVTMELEDMKAKYKQKENECQIAEQMKETTKLLEDAQLKPSALELVYTSLDMEGTKKKIETLKNYIEEMKKEILSACMDTPLPQVSNDGTYDAFIDGFDNNEI